MHAARYLAVALGVVLVWVFSCRFVERTDEPEQFNQAIRARYAIYPPDMPSSLKFCGESVPLTRLDVREALDREVLVNMYWQSNTLLYLKRAGQWFPLIEKVLREENLPSDLKYLAVIESGLMQSVSPAGAAGFWQIMKTTGVEYGLEVNAEVDERYHVEKATRAACKYLRQAYARFGNSWSTAAAAYNMGMQGMSNQIAFQEVASYYDLFLNDETARYVYRILAIKLIMERPENYGFHLRNADLYSQPDTRSVTVSSSVASLVKFAAQHNTTYKMVKLLNPWLRGRSLPIRAGKIYSILLPDGSSNGSSNGSSDSSSDSSSYSSADSSSENE